MIASRIPIVIGVTGHRDIREDDIPELQKIVRDKLLYFKNKYPNSPVHMVNSMAAGADLLCAQEAVNLGIPLFCALPMNVTSYKEDFTDDQWEVFQKLILHADSVFVVPNAEPYENNRDYLYRQAGIYVATHSHVLFALWDGSVAKVGGCGTAEAVDFMLKGNYKSGHFFNASNDGAVFHISTPRKKNEVAFPITATLIENEKGSLDEVLLCTERINKDAAKVSSESGYYLIPVQYQSNSTIRRLQKVYTIADALSLKWQKKYLLVLSVFAIFSVGLVLLYLLYDEGESVFCLLFYGIILLFYALLHRFVNKNMHQERYLQYRALAEAIRVQMYYCSLCINENVCHDFTWTQKHDATWIKEAVNALLIGPPSSTPMPKDIIQETWIIGQRDYHKKAYLRVKHKQHTQQIIASGAIFLTILMFFVVLLLEVFFPNTMLQLVGPYSIRTWTKILWGCLSAVSVFISSFYGKMALDRKAFDHQKMAALFESALEQTKTNPEHINDILTQLGKEELVENGNWISYNKENSIDFSL